MNEAIESTRVICCLKVLQLVVIETIDYYTSLLDLLPHLVCEVQTKIIINSLYHLVSPIEIDLYMLLCLN